MAQSPSAPSRRTPSAPAPSAAASSAPTRSALQWCAAAVLLSVFGFGAASAGQRENDNKKPSLSLKANPPLGFSPLRVRLAVDVRGGSESDPDLYCPTIEWEWGDEQVSSSSEDCPPFDAGKSAIRRRYTVEHVFRYSGNYRVTFRLKQKDRTIASATTDVQVRGGVRDDFGD